MDLLPGNPKTTRRISIVALVGLIVLLGVSNWIFISYKSAPRGVDELDVWSGTLIYITQGYGLAGLFTAQPQDFMNMPPLLPWAGWIARELAGPSYAAMALVVTLFQALLLLAVFNIGRRLAGDVEGLLAACVVACSPIVMPFARTFMTNVPALAMAACVIWSLLYSERFTRRGSGVLVGVVLGLALLSERGTPPLLLSVPLLYYALLSLYSVRRRRRALLRVLGRGLCAVAIALALSALYLRQYLRQNLDHISELASDDFFPSVGSWLDALPEPLFYPVALFTHQLSYAWGLLLLIALPFFLRRLEGERGLILLVMVWPMAIMSTFATKYFDFDLGTLIGAALVLGVGLGAINRPRLRRAALGLGFGTALLMFWFIQPDLLPHPQYPPLVRLWLEDLYKFDLRTQDQPVFQDATYRRLEQRIPPGPHYLFVIHAPDDGRVRTLFCEIGNFAWLHYGDADQVTLIDPQLPADAPLLIDVWETTTAQRDRFASLIKRRSCPYIIRDPLPLPDRGSCCRTVYADELDGVEVRWSLCRWAGAL
ncbi:MAG: glycosyltransferase family 39 protein [Candidatus Alcyoniella australis]|nr:glycosyltransferase family 39 protein [Candidatus Alcyoniella australis]